MPNPPILVNLVYNLPMRESVRSRINNGAQNQDAKIGGAAAVFVYAGRAILLVIRLIYQALRNCDGRINLSLASAAGVTDAQVKQFVDELIGFARLAQNTLVSLFVGDCWAALPRLPSRFDYFRLAAPTRPDLC